MNPPVSTFGVLTSYGYPADSTPDTNSANAIGMCDNHLTDHVSLAVSRDIEADFRTAGIHPLGQVELTLENGTVLNVVWADRTAVAYHGKNLTGRFDLYCAVKPHPLTGTAVTAFRKLS